ncbi:serine/arginine-rich splicing factor 6-like [Forsythia ovata]|uniref:Serine/arginine-rich splicing factor 6-like n=1 Tax=Forsythia ovata TaxID=205694 RepID=A0ABD1WZY1_9LAMI
MHLSSSPNKIQTYYRRDEELVKGVGGSKSKNIKVAVENESAAATLRMEEEETKKDLAQREDAHNIAITSGSCKVLESYRLQPDNSNYRDNLLLQSGKETREPPNEDCVV